MMEDLNLIKEQKEICFINDCNALVDYKELANAILWYAKSPVMSKKHIYMHGEYPAVSIIKDKIHIHRLLMMYWIGTDLPKCYFVHHIDGNKLNATKENLSLVFNSKHQSYHNKGKTITNEHKESIRKFNHSQKGKRRKYKVKISAEQVYNLKLQGYSFNKISQILGLDWECVKQRYEDFIHDNPELLKEEMPSEKYKEFYEKKKAITERLRKDNEDFEK